MHNYKHYVLGVLTVILAWNLVDRIALGIVLQDVKADLDLTDTQLGFLGGMAFALFYSVMGIPIARWADRGNRVLIIALTAALWSVAVILCGVAESYPQLLAIRVVVAIGEAGCVPPALSLIADYFTRAERPRATSLYGMGGPLSVVIGFFVAGWLNELYGWRATFMLLGLPGLLLAVLARFTLLEPRCKTHASSEPRSHDHVGAELAQPALREVCALLWRNTTFRRLLLCVSLNFFFGYGIQQWLPAFFARSYGLTTGQIGTWLAAILVSGGLLGVYGCTRWIARYAAHNERLQLLATAIAIACSGVLAVLAYLSSNMYVGFTLLGLFAAGLMTLNGPLTSTIQTLVPERMRATAFAVVYLFANLIGMGLGPLAAGFLSDALRPSMGDESLRYGLLILSPGYFLCAWYAWRASKTVLLDLAASPERFDDTAPQEGRVPTVPLKART